MGRLIDEEDAINALREEFKRTPTMAIRAKYTIEQLPLAQSERKTGKWIKHHEPYTWMGYTYWSCSNCGFECGYDKEIRIKTDFCPHCGMNMRGEEDENQP